MTRFDFRDAWGTLLTHRMHLNRHLPLKVGCVVAIAFCFLVDPVSTFLQSAWAKNFPSWIWQALSWKEIGTRFLFVFDGGAIGFLVVAWWIMMHTSPNDMPQRAKTEDVGRHTALIVSATLATTALLVIFVDLYDVKKQPDKVFRVLLAMITIVLSWLVMNATFARHYAHEFYRKANQQDGGKGGLSFPSRPHPDYWDFLYFSFVIGMTFQVSDVQIENHYLRRVAIGHGLLAFIFNVVVLTLTIGIVVDLLS